jgi:glycosyltransferase involved in cell wall biosynthesis
MFAKSRFETRFFEGQTLEEMTELMKRSDISWFEWCTELPAFASKLPKVCKNIIRLHRYEAFTHWPGEMNWDNIDTLITIGNDHVRKRLTTIVPGIEFKTHIVDIPNGINLERFKLHEKPRGKNIAFVGSLNMKKNPPYLLHCFSALHRIDPEYKLFITGKYQDEVLEQYMRYMVNELGLNESIFFEGWHDDVNAWLADKHYIVSSSIVEGHPVGVMEAMSCGLKPVVHNFPGAKKFFPEEFLYEGVHEFCEMILSTDYESRRYRRFIEESYPLQEQLRRINEIFMVFESELASNRRNIEPLIPAGTRGM